MEDMISYHELDMTKFSAGYKIMRIIIPLTVYTVIAVLTKLPAISDNISGIFMKIFGENMTVMASLMLNLTRFICLALAVYGGVLFMIKPKFEALALYRLGVGFINGEYEHFVPHENVLFKINNSEKNISISCGVLKIFAYGYKLKYFKKYHLLKHVVKKYCNTDRRYYIKR